jgi:hypothetical protein
MKPCGRQQDIEKLEIVFVVGNGISRKDFDLNSLVGVGPIVICNEAYREFSSFDAIASVDGLATEDIQENCDLEGKKHIYKWRSNWYIGRENQDKLIGSYNSGQLALRGAIELYSPDVVYTLGIDLGGERLYTGKISGQPTNKCWDTWNLLENKTRVVSVGRQIRYDDFEESIEFWARCLG